ncbi:MAG: hypothetical protein KJ011_13910 [Burkholderiaceae bacterium]|nr:hypothetical protein [Burkholderiaceae bacterium]
MRFNDAYQLATGQAASVARMTLRDPRASIHNGDRNAAARNTAIRHR